MFSRVSANCILFYFMRRRVLVFNKSVYRCYVYKESLKNVANSLFEFVGSKKWQAQVWKSFISAYTRPDGNKDPSNANSSIAHQSIDEMQKHLIQK